jgi:hypothetical protein
MLQRTDATTKDAITNECYNERMLQRMMLQRTVYLLTPWSRILLEKLTDLQLAKKFPAFYGAHSSLPHSQEPATCPYPKPAQSSTYPTSHFRSYQRKNPALRLRLIFRKRIHFHGEDLLAPHPTPKLEDHPSSATHDCLFKIFTATLHNGGRSSIRKLRTPYAIVTGTH